MAYYKFPFFSLVFILLLGCSKDEDPIVLDFEKVFIESITLNSLTDYEEWDMPGKPDLFFELILEPSTFVTTSLLLENVDLPAIWDQEIPLPGDKESTYFMRFTDQDIGVLDEQIFAVNLRPALAYPETLLVFSSDGNDLEIRLRFE